VGPPALLRHFAIAAVCLAVLLSGATVAARASSPLAGSVDLPGVVTDVGSIPTGAITHPVPGGQLLHLTLTLRPRDPAGLATLLQGITTPSSSDYRQFLTDQDFTRQFSPLPSTEQSLQSYFSEYGADEFVPTPDGFGLAFSISSQGAAGALGVSFSSFESHGVAAFTAVGTPQLPGGLEAGILAISGLSGTAGPHLGADVLDSSGPHPVASSPNSWVTDGAGAGEPWFLGSDFTSAFGVSSLFPPSTAVHNATFPNRTAVATILMSGYNSTLNANLPPYDPVVVQAYYNDTFPAAWPQPNISGVPVNVSGITPPAPGYFNNSNDTTANSIENSLDLEMAGSMAPGATLVNFYFAGSLFASSQSSASLGEIADDFAACLSAALTHNYSGARLAAVSGSFGLTDLNDSLWNVELEEAAATGVTVVAASGDQGDAPSDLTGRFQGQWPTWPASAAFDTYGAIAVGGTTVTLDGSPTEVITSNYTLNATFDPTVTGIVTQTAWFDTLGGYGNVSGSEGGISEVYAEPSWQFESAAQPAIVNATVDQGYGSLGRAEPDLAFPANTTVAYVARNASGIYYEVVEGTSIAAPLFAGMIATWSAVTGHLFGFLDPELYRIAGFYAAEASAGGTPPASVPATPWYDVTQGSNYEFSAAPGWDAVTGWGSLDGVGFLAADANSSIADYVYTGPTPGLPPPIEVGPGTEDQYVILFIGIVLATVVVVALNIGTRRPTAPAPSVYGPGTAGEDWTPPLGYPGAPSGLPPPAPGTVAHASAPPPMTFLCPYCGAPRPAEPTRCPSCGRL
jgi:subtilase family serine protease